jgi:hypothetical protein
MFPASLGSSGGGAKSAVDGGVTRASASEIEGDGLSEEDPEATDGNNSESDSETTQRGTRGTQWQGLPRLATG